MTVFANAAWYGEHDIDEFLTFAITTSQFSSGAGIDATDSPAYAIYEDETAAEVVSGTLAKLDDAGSIGFYTERVQLTDANFDAGKMYTIYITATVDAVAGTTSHAFKMRAAPIALTTDVTGAHSTTDTLITNRTLAAADYFLFGTDPVELLDSGGSAGTSAAELVVDVWGKDVSAFLDTNLTGGILIWLFNVMEGDSFIDTTQTPWQAVVNKKGTPATEYLRKDLFDVSGGNVTSVATVIGKQTEP